MMSFLICICLPSFYLYPINNISYLQQLVCFLTVILVSKLILGMMMYSVAGFLADVGSFIFSPLRLHPNTELVVVMIVCPCFLNIVQYWLVDNFLSEKGDAGKSRERYSYLGMLIILLFILFLVDLC